MIQRWVDQNGISRAVRGVLGQHIDFISAGGPRVLPGCIFSLGDHIHGIKTIRKGEIPMNALFCYGPFPPFDREEPEQDTGEITLLTGSLMGREALKAAGVVARRNLEILRGDRKRRAYARISL